MKRIQLLAALCLVAALAVPSYGTDISFGTFARYTAMGGAGLAVSEDGSTSVINPACAAASGERLTYIYPSIELHALGGSTRNVEGRIDDFMGASSYEVTKLARDFGRQTTTLNASGVLGFAGTIGATLAAEAEGIVSPGANFRDWALRGAPTSADDLLAWGLIPDTTPASLATYASTLADNTFVAGRLVYDLPAVSYSTGFDLPGGEIFVGGRLRWLHSEVRRWDISGTSDATSVGLASTELPSQIDEGLGGDLGFIFRPDESRVQFGMVINNALDPSLSGINTDTMLSVGASSRLSRRLLVVADLVNINGAGSGDAQIRAGAEWIFNRKFAVRGGFYDSNVTFGFHAFGIDVAVSPEHPYVISRTLRF